MGVRPSVCSCCCIDVLSLLFQLSLFFDVLLALCVNMTEDHFIERGRVSVSLSAGGDTADISLVRSARRLVWRQLKGFSMKARLFSFSLLTVCFLGIRSAFLYVP